MRVEPYGVGSVVHVVKRGARGMDITGDDADRWRFVRLLYLLNDHHQDDQRAVRPEGSLFERPAHWPERNPLTSILAWMLHKNHLHLLLRENEEGGVSKFMQRLGGSMTTHYNKKYEESGSLFQGAYKSKTVDDDAYLRYVLPYIVVKNVFELYPKGGFGGAIAAFDEAWKWAVTYPFSSFMTSASGAASPIIDRAAYDELGLSMGEDDFKNMARDMLCTHVSRREEFAHLLLEDW